MVCLGVIFILGLLLVRGETAKLENWDINYPLTAEDVEEIESQDGMHCSLHVHLEITIHDDAETTTPTTETTTEPDEIIYPYVIDLDPEDSTQSVTDGPEEAVNRKNVPKYKVSQEVMSKPVFQKAVLQKAVMSQRVPESQDQGRSVNWRYILIGVACGVILLLGCCACCCESLPFESTTQPKETTNQHRVNGSQLSKDLANFERRKKEQEREWWREAQRIV